MDLESNSFLPSAQESSSDTHYVPSGEIPHFFLNPSSVIPGFEHVPEADKHARANRGRGKVLKSRLYGSREVGGVEERVYVDVSPPNFVVGAMARLRKQDPMYRIRVKPR
jgi:hypothetical protein